MSLPKIDERGTWRKVVGFFEELKYLPELFQVCDRGKLFQCRAIRLQLDVLQVLQPEGKIRAEFIRWLLFLLSLATPTCCHLIESISS